MYRLAFALEYGNLFAYCLLFIILYPPIMVIVLAIINKFKK